MSGELPDNLRPIADFFGLPGTAPVAKDFHVVRAIAALAVIDAAEFGNQFPAYAADISGETRKAVDALRTDPLHRERYAQFLANMVYGEKVEFATALATVTAAVEVWLAT